MANEVGPNDHKASYRPTTKQVALGVFHGIGFTLWLAREN